ncbi:putative T7SS-secreted protein [Actinokineospora pegani]|uniref:putative T7SS-secreted protein n=1 Tax=Actinokineospora pegani TaxID=2654637 RepID=UPI0012E9E521|nr:hypothetical protein [Actinokineospora pegani]
MDTAAQYETTEAGLAELGQSRDPRELVPGDPAALRATATGMQRFGEAPGRVGDGLRAIDDGGWTGEAADRFRDHFDEEPRRWVTCGESFDNARDAPRR